MNKLDKKVMIADGKAKQIFTTNDPELVWIHSKNQATALNGKRKVQIEDKGYYTNQISGRLFEYLTKKGIKNHFVEAVNDTDVISKRLTMIPLEVVTRNYASGHFVTKYAVKPMIHLVPPVQEFYYKSDELDDPMINESQIEALNILNADQLAYISAEALKINDLLKVIFADMNIRLVDFKVEFGFDIHNNIILGDELSPDNMRIVDETTGKSLDKDIFRKNLGSLTAVYDDVLNRLKKELGE
ncbi:phosphoribosylaminoimidazolesuccinocarboxamide synthase [Fructilactobacillus sp. Tb1]|uniref:phosphoribosylaminoimidazolesuccinocarboxamide synthase n=1 Tax=Fructilactobacillus sp. Tb1 TaxID=3422304 RepID=UPI003D2B65D9